MNESGRKKRVNENACMNKKDEKSNYDNVHMST